MHSLHRQHSGFTLVELMVGMLIFAIGLTGIYALLQSTFRNAAYSRHEMVAANILREQIELIKNIRDTNIQSFAPWDRARMEQVASSSFQSGVYIIENDYTTTGSLYNTNGDIERSPVFLRDITSAYGLSGAMKDRFALTRLYLDAHGRYTHTLTQSGTNYASYVIVRPLMINGVSITKDGKPQGYSIDARFIVSTGDGYREYDARSAITDWIR